MGPSARPDRADGASGDRQAASTAGRVLGASSPGLATPRSAESNADRLRRYNDKVN
jgi:hypothetical protein